MTLVLCKSEPNIMNPDTWPEPHTAWMVFIVRKRPLTVVGDKGKRHSRSLVISLILTKMRHSCASSSFFFLLLRLCIWPHWTEFKGLCINLRSNSVSETKQVWKQMTNVCHRSNFLWIVLVTNVSAWPSDSDNKPTDTPLQTLHNNKASSHWTQSAVHYNQMLRSKTACHAAIWHAEIRLDEIQFKVQEVHSPARSDVQSALYKQRARGGALVHEEWHT